MSYYLKFSHVTIFPSYLQMTYITSNLGYIASRMRNLFVLKSLDICSHLRDNPLCIWIIIFSSLSTWRDIPIGSIHWCEVISIHFSQYHTGYNKAMLIILSIKCMIEYNKMFPRSSFFNCNKVFILY